MNLSKLLYAHHDPNNYDPSRLIILVALMEMDGSSLVEPPGLQNLHSQLQSWSHLPPVTQRVLLETQFNVCMINLAAQTDHIRIGGVQQLQVSIDVWNTLKNNQNVTPQTLEFDGWAPGIYRLTFRFE